MRVRVVAKEGLAKLYLSQSTLADLLRCSIPKQSHAVRGRKIKGLYPLHAARHQHISETMLQTSNYRESISVQ